MGPFYNILCYCKRSSSLSAGLHKTIDVRSLSQGMYLVEIRKADGNFTVSKIVISK
jgi:hypothetical protein